MSAAKVGMCRVDALDGDYVIVTIFDDGSARWESYRGKSLAPYCILDGELAVRGAIFTGLLNGALQRNET